MASDINATLRQTGDGLGFMLAQIADPIIALVIGLGIATSVVLLFKGLMKAIGDKVDG